MPKTALIIDNVADLPRLNTLFVDRGFDVSTAEGMHDLAYRPAYLDVDLIVLNLNLGPFSGIDVLDLLQERRIDSAIILISDGDTPSAGVLLRAGLERGLRMLGLMPRTVSAATLEQLLAPLETTQRPLTALDIDQGLAQQEFALEYQPKFDLESNTPCGFEALLRWHIPERGPVPPSRFIALAERDERIISLSWYAIDRAWALHARLIKQGYRLNIAVNIPPPLLGEPNVLERMDQLARRHQCSPKGMVLEITETSIIESISYARHMLEGFRARGFQLSLDDFGTGYSSMTQLAHLPYDELKLDRSFIAQCHEGDAEAITRSIVELGQRLGLRVVAEGIETQEQFQFLKTLGCDCGQGFHLARPMPEHDVETWLSSWALSTSLTP
ncbi:EAL domain-containing response regulator [Larsenimonas salina]|uniref:EAL domain-containing response regulator n=1 Tax=Larsenimonas salina TaxID=1295565 RepID=UPI002073EA3C|nr:EAL domain-containing response regulator [Larsenimonas salina]MCM5704871.1 EAL domain-containing response regulator [Larsenimonas salina]